MKRWIVLMVLGTSLLATTAFAKEQTHDGFFMRISLGAGEMTTTLTDLNVGNVTLNDLDGYSTLQFGGAISDDLVLFVESSTVSMDQPEASFAGGSGYLKGTLSSSLFGIGVARYYMPYNAFVSATVGTATTSIESKINGTRDSGNGFGINLAAGKEWWVGKEFGLGLGGHVLYTNCSGGDISVNDVKTRAIGLFLTLTYN